MIFHQMTWPELRGIDWQDTLVLIPVGATEQHGHHLPVDTDTRLVTMFANELEARNPGRILLTPTMWLGHSPHHLSFGGTLSVYHQVYADMVVSVCRSCIGMGARKIWILNGHGGNRMPLGVVLQQLKNEFADVLVTASEYWNIAREEITSIRESEFGGLGHACELETSLYLYINEAGVRLDLIRDDGVQAEGSMFRSDMLAGSAAARVMNFDELTASGVFGRPTLASREKGERLFHAIADKLDAFAEELHTIGKQGSH